jgi:hypothetical protein
LTAKSEYSHPLKVISPLHLNCRRRYSVMRKLIIQLRAREWRRMKWKGF